MKISNLIKKYGDRTVLSIPDFQLEAGKHYAVVGANGSGKSTLLKIISSVLKADGGKIEYPDQTQISYMPQKCFGFAISVFHNLTIANKDKQQAEDMLEAFALTRLRKKSGAKLSGGETQRMCLARTLLSDYTILLLDEPTAAMDIHSAKKAEETIAREVADKNATLLFATHSILQAQKLADYILFMADGKIIEICNAKEFITAAKEPETKAFLEYFAGAQSV